MQKEAGKTNTGEKRWTNVGPDGVEFLSSHNGVVGWFIGYATSVGRRTGCVTPSREQQAEWGMRWDLVPPLCRPDNIEAKNTQVRQQQAGSSHEEAPVDVEVRQQQARSSHEEAPVDVNEEEDDAPDWG